MFEYLRQLGTMSKGVRLFLYSEALLGIAFGLYSLLYNLHLLSLGLDEADAGKLTSLGTMVMAVSAIPLAITADRLGRKKVLVSGLFLYSLGLFVVAFGKDYAHFVSAQVLSALGASMLVTVEFPLLFGYCRTRREQTLAYSLVFAVFTFFNGMGTFLGGFLPRYLPEGSTIYQSTLIVMAVFALLTGLARLFLPADQRKPGHSVKAERKGLAAFIPSKTVMIYVFGSFLIGIAFALTTPFYNIIIKFRLDWSDEWVGILMTANGLIMFLGSLLTPYFLEQFGTRKTAFGVLITSGGLSLLLGTSIPTGMFVTFFLIRNGFFVAVSNVLEGQAMQATPDEERSVLGGLRSVGRSVGSTIGAYAAGIILATKNYTLPFLLTGVSLALILIYFAIWMIPHLEKEESTPDPEQNMSVS
ncbi:MAG: MFS transporter [Bacillaceae bacterium]|nr:MFS transporter [Bacillaceae bacterium]